MSEEFVPRVVIVDDQPLVRSMVVAKVTSFGCEVVGQGENGREGIELWEREKPDLILLDLHMPKVDGEYAAKYILSLHPDAYVVVLTTKRDPDAMRELLLNVGVRAWVNKDLEPELLDTELKKHIERVKQGNDGASG